MNPAPGSRPLTTRSDAFLVIESDDAGRCENELRGYLKPLARSMNTPGEEANGQYCDQLPGWSLAGHGYFSGARKHRPRTVFLPEGEEQILFSPASVDFGGVCITPLERDFNRMNRELLTDMFSQLSVSKRRAGCRCASCTRNLAPHSRGPDFRKPSPRQSGLVFNPAKSSRTTEPVHNIRLPIPMDIPDRPLPPSGRPESGPENCPDAAHRISAERNSPMRTPSSGICVITQVGGVILFDYDVVMKTYGRNVTSPDQLRNLMQQLYKPHKIFLPSSPSIRKVAPLTGSDPNMVFRQPVRTKRWDNSTILRKPVGKGNTSPDCCNPTVST